MKAPGGEGHMTISLPFGLPGVAEGGGGQRRGRGRGRGRRADAGEEQTGVPAKMKHRFNIEEYIHK